MRATLLVGNDPSAKAAVAAMARWASEACTCGTLGIRAVGIARMATWWTARLGGGGGPGPVAGWARVNGPISAAWCEAQRLGWTWPNPFLLQAAEGEEISMLVCSASAVARRLREAVMRQHAVQLAEAAWPDGGGGRVAVEPILAHLASKKVDPAPQRHREGARVQSRVGPIQITGGWVRGGGGVSALPKGR